MSKAQNLFGTLQNFDLGNGLQGTLHSLPQLAGVPVIMLSGRDPEKHRDDALAAGAVAYLAKPITPEELMAAVVTALGGDPDSA